MIALVSYFECSGHSIHYFTPLLSHQLLHWEVLLLVARHLFLSQHLRKLGWKYL